jgi:hypothetical protein
MGLLSRCLPQMRMIHLVRHPCGQVASKLRGDQTGAMPLQIQSIRKLLALPQAQKYGLSYEEFQQLDTLSQLALQWAIRNEKAMDEMEGDDSCITLRYEDLCETPVETTQNLFAFAGLQFADQTSQFLNACLQSQGGKYYGVFHDPKKAASKWQRELPERDIAKVKSLVQDSRPGALYW